MKIEELFKNIQQKMIEHPGIEVEVSSITPNGGPLEEIRILSYEVGCKEFKNQETKTVLLLKEIGGI